MTETDLLARHRAVMPGWLTLYYDEPIEIVRGEGRRVFDANGSAYLDFFAGILTNAIGYDIAEISDAVRAQLDTGVLHTSTLYLIRRQIELAERIAQLSGIDDAKVFFTNSGSEANDTALMLATQHRRSHQVLALRNSYAGRSHATIAVTGNRSWSATALSPIKVSYVHGGYRYRSPFRDYTDADYVAACVADLRDVIETTTSGDVACMIVEPVQGVGGLSSPPDGLFHAFHEVLQEYGILLISDEVQTGWGRTGEHLWGIQAHDVTPDAMTFAKGLGNGLAIGGVVARAELMDCLTANSISTFGGNPLSTAGAGAALEFLLSHDLQGNAAKLGARLISGLRDAARHCPIVGEVRGKGLMIGIELITSDGAPNRTAASAVHELTRQRGLLIGKGGLHANVLRVSPPMTLTEAEAEEGLTILADVLTAVDRSSSPDRRLRPQSTNTNTTTHRRDMMRALEVTEPGKPTDLTEVTVDAPTPGPNQVTIDVAYSGYNFADSLGVIGASGYAPGWPLRPGMEIAGTVRALGSGTSGLAVGQRVAALLPGTGGYAEVAIATADLTVPVPDGLELSLAAGVPLTVSTAALFLKTTNFAAGQTLLVHSASGALAGILAALARNAGATRLLGVVGREASISVALAAGYDHVVLRSPSWPEEIVALNGGAGVDVAFDPIGGASLTATLKAVGLGGTLISCGNASGEEDVSVSAAALRKQLVCVGGFSILGYARNRPAAVAEQIANGLALVADGTLELTRDVQPLSSATQIHEAAMAHASSGKVIFDVHS